MDLRAVNGSGPGGYIRAGDLGGTTGAVSSSVLDGTRPVLASRRRRETLTTVAEVDVTDLLPSRARTDDPLGFGGTAALLSAVSGALARILPAHPGVTRAAHDDEQPTMVPLTMAGEGVLFDTPVLPAGSTVALSIGAPVRRPAVIPGSSDETGIAIRALALLALSYDHGQVDGDDAVRFLGDLRLALGS